MIKKSHIHVSDLAGLNVLATHITLGVTDLAEALHNNVASSPGIVGAPLEESSRAIAALVYESIRGVTRSTEGATDAMLAQFGPVLDQSSSPEREAVLAALNGLMGDYLAATGNPLAIPMRLRRGGQPLTLETKALIAAIAPPRDKLLLLVHGLCMNDLQWKQNRSDFGAALARDLGYTPIHLHYNTGLHTSTNGRALAALGRHEDPQLTLSFAPSRQWVGYAMNHWNLLNRPTVYKQIKRWLESPTQSDS